MAFDILEWLKRMGGDDASLFPTQPKAEDASQGPALLNTAPSAASAQPTAQTQESAAEAPLGGGLLNVFGIRSPWEKFAPDPETRAALRDSMIQGFANMAVASGPSTDVSHSSLLSAAGIGAATAAKGYNDHLTNAADNRAKNAEADKISLLKQQTANNAAIAGALPTGGPDGMSADQLYETAKLLWANGKFSEATDMLKMAQAKQQWAASHGMNLSDGAVSNVPGSVDAQSEVEQGKQTGTNQANLETPATANVQDYTYYANQERAAGRTPKSVEEWSNTKASAGSTKINNTMGGTSSGDIFKVMQEKSDAATKAVVGNDAIRNARDLVNSGVIAGAGAESILGLKKIASFFGADASAVENTETLKSAIAPQIASTMRQIAGSAQFSDGDRKFAAEAAGGNISLDPGSMVKIFDLMERANNAIIADYNQRLDKVYPDSEGGKYAREREILRLQAPSYQKPSKLLGGRVDTATGLNMNSEGVPVVNSAADRAKLKPGQKFIGPDGLPYTN